MIVYRERVLPSVGALVLPALLFPSVIAVMLPLNPGAAFPVAALITTLFCAYIFFSAPVIVVTSDSFIARGATIDRKYIGELESIAKQDVFEELGRKLDARAWLSIQASVKGLVKVQISDSQDPTPYWLVSTRRPSDLMRALRN